ncbi:hypothetical protein CF326_g9291 [Tilletia indica]|nr:hypothetical protein CF326_g9291 [Tilletia indica]
MSSSAGTEIRLCAITVCYSSPPTQPTTLSTRSSTFPSTRICVAAGASTGKKIAGVPLSIKAVFEAIHESPQEGEIDGLTLGLPWNDQAHIEALVKKCVVQAEEFAKGLGCQFFGMIYTDLTPADPTLERQEPGRQSLAKET